MRGPAGRTRIYGFVTKEKNYSRQSDISTQDPVLVKKLYSACRVLLPSYMIPKFVVVSSIPLNTSGKVDERRLTKIVKDCFHTSPGGGVGTATGDLQDMLATIVAARFSGNAPSVDDDLRSYGLTSLDFMVFIKDVKTTFGVSLTSRQFFRNPDIRSIAKVLQEGLSRAHSAPHVQIDCGLHPGSTADEHLTKPAHEHEFRWVDPSAGQQLIFAAQSVLRNHAYNCNFVLRIGSFLLMRRN
jgi:acyl carrier protein